DPYDEGIRPVRPSWSHRRQHEYRSQWVAIGCAIAHDTLPWVSQAIAPGIRLEQHLDSACVELRNRTVSLSQDEPVPVRNAPIEAIVGRKHTKGTHRCRVRAHIDTIRRRVSLGILQR